MTRFLYDSITAPDIPLNATMVAGYLDGFFAWPQSYWSIFPNAIKVEIVVSASTNAGQVLDVENGDAFPWEAPGWCQMRREAGQDPTIYTNYSNWAPTVTEFVLRGIPLPNWWIAYWDGNPQLISGTIATQYANPTFTGGHYDLSVVADFWPGVDKEDEMTPDEHNALMFLRNWVNVPVDANGNPLATWGSYLDMINNKLDSMRVKLNSIPTTSLTTAQAQQLSDVVTGLNRLLGGLFPK